MHYNRYYTQNETKEVTDTSEISGIGKSFPTLDDESERVWDGSERVWEGSERVWEGSERDSAGCCKSALRAEGRVLVNRFAIHEQCMLL
ncbi:unnamed protein product [Angiostrongylus costaricensis]|uniref:Uncharacterized protein n=1 Tax=Angiostrongylus costaricensis TaxID=334426 RepID=A0A0R3PAH3_ANGCS|nr:unnamed protein product [Angiostrongylus costaricensis]